MTESIARARMLLTTPVEGAGSPWAALFAAGLCASAAVLMAGAVILGPGISVEPPAAVQPATS